MDKQPTCEERIDRELAREIAAIRAMWVAYEHGEDTDSLYEHGLAFDYVLPGTFEDQDEGYWRWQISWGGPSDEFRFFASNPEFPCYRIEYRFMDWWDGATRVLAKGTLEGDLMREIWKWWQEIDLQELVLRSAKEAA